MDLSHEIQLHLVIVADQAIEARNRIVRGENNGFQFVGHSLQFAQIGGCFTDQEIEVHGGNRRALQGRCRISDENRFEALFTQRAGHSD